MALGHRRIARVGGLPDLMHTQNRTNAFNDVCRALNLGEAVGSGMDAVAQGAQRVTSAAAAAMARSVSAARANPAATACTTT